MSVEAQEYKKVTLSPPVKRKQGRPPFKPTGEQRDQVIAMSSNGVPHRQQASLIGCSSPKTLRKHFRDDLNIGKIQANAKSQAHFTSQHWTVMSKRKPSG